VAGTAGLPGLARETRERLRRRRKANGQETRHDEDNCNRDEQPAVPKLSSKTNAIVPHRAPPRCSQHSVQTHEYRFESRSRQQQ
jgi:hypothetical protein